MAKSKKHEVPELNDLDYLLLVRLHQESLLRKETAVRAARAVSLEYKRYGKLQNQIPRLVENELITINNTWCRLTQRGTFVAASILRQIHYKVLQDLD